jgi:hypothetical protein
VYREAWVETERAKPSSEYVQNTGNGYSVWHPNDLADKAQDWAIREINAGRTFPIHGTWIVHRLAEALRSVLARTTVLTDHVLPRPDRPKRNGDAYDTAYSDAALQAYLSAVFLAAFNVYQQLAELNFGEFRSSLRLLRAAPLEVRIEYTRSDLTTQAGQRWGHLTYAIYRGRGDSHEALVTLDPQEFTFLKQISTRAIWKSDNPPICGPVFADPHRFFIADGPSFGGERIAGESRHALIRSIAYRFLRDDFRNIYSSDRWP